MLDKKILLSILLIVFCLTVISGCIINEDKPLVGTEVDETPEKSYEGKKVLYIDSYHEGYAWSDGITKGVRETLDNTGVELKVHRMDTKRNPEEEFKKQATLSAKSVIEEFQPDVVIASDDNAVKYLIMPYYKDADLPVVFCGLNWDASLYDLPYKNTAGMVEVSLTTQIIEILKEYARGDRVGYLSADILTERKNLEYYDKLFDLDFDKIYLVTTLEDWKEAFLKLQDEVDLLIFENNAGIVDWEDDEAEAFALENTNIPVGTTNPWIMQSSLLGLTKIPEEQGEWSAQTALEILNGTSPADIPLTTNKRGGIIINLKIAEKLGVVLRPDLLKNAEIIE